MVPCSTQCWSLKDLQLPAAVLFLGVNSHAARKLSSPCHKPSNSTQHPDECVCMADLVHTTTEDPSKTVPQALAGPQLSHVNATRHFTYSLCSRQPLLRSLYKTSLFRVSPTAFDSSLCGIFFLPSISSRVGFCSSPDVA